MAEFVNMGGELHTFETAEDADNFVRRAQDAAQQDRQAVEYATQFEVQEQQQQVQPDAQSGAVPDPSTVQLQRNGQVWEFPSDQVNERMAAGFRPVSDDEMAAYEERTAQKEAALDVPLAGARTALEQFGATLASPGAALVGWATDTDISGNEALAGWGGFFTGSSQEEIARNMRYRAEEYEVTSAISQVAATMLPIGRISAATKGLSGLKRGAAWGIEGGVSGAFIGREQNWITDPATTNDDLLMNMGIAALFGIGGEALGTKARGLFKSFAKSSDKLPEAAMGGKITDYFKKTAKDFAGGGEEWAAKADWEGQGIAFDKIVTSRGKVTSLSRQAAAQDAVFQRDILMNDGTPMRTHGSGKGLEIARNAEKRALEVQAHIPKALGNGMVAAPDIMAIGEEMMATGYKMALKGPEAKLGRTFRDGWVNNVLSKKQRKAYKKAKAKGKLDELDMSLWQMPVKGLLKQHKNFKEIVSGLPEGQQKYGAQLMDQMEEIMASAAQDPARYLKLQAESDFFRRTMPMYREVLAGGGESSPSMTKAVFKYAHGTFLKVTGFHALRGGSRQIAGISDAVDMAQSTIIQTMVAKRIYKGTESVKAAVKLGTDSAFAGAVARGKAWAAKNADVSKYTGGFITKAFYQGLHSTPRVTFTRGGASLTDSYFARVEELEEAGRDMEQMTYALQGHLGDAAEMHPMLTQSLTISAMNGYTALVNSLPAKLAGDSPLMPQVKGHPPSEGELVSFQRKYDAVMNPWSVLEDFANGRVTPEGREMLELVYPAFYEHIQNEIMGNLGNLKEPPAPDVAAQIEIMLGMPGSLERQRAPDFQVVYSMALEQARAEQGQGGGGPQKGNAGGGRKSGNPSFAQQFKPLSQSGTNIGN